MGLRLVQIYLVVFAAIVIVIFGRDFFKNREKDYPTKYKLFHCVLGFVANFFDTLGIGSFAPSITIYNAFHMVDDRKLVPTMNAAISLPVIAEALCFITSVKVDFKTLILMAVLAMVGSFVGSRLQGRVSELWLNRILGLGLLIAAFFIFAGLVGIMPTGGTASGLSGWKLIFACAANFLIGVAVNFGIGSYAPCMCVVYLLGMSPLVAFPIMMLSACSICPVAGISYVRQGNVVRWLYGPFNVFGVLGVIAAVFLVKSMPLTVLQWIVCGVIIYSGITILHKSVKMARAKIAPEGTRA